MLFLYITKTQKKLRGSKGDIVGIPKVIAESDEITLSLKQKRSSHEIITESRDDHFFEMSEFLGIC